MIKPRTRLLEFPDNRLAASLFGEYDRHLKRIEEGLGVEIIPRGNVLAITADAEGWRRTKRLLSELYALLTRGEAVDMSRVEDGLRVLGQTPVDGKGAGADSEEDGEDAAAPGGEWLPPYGDALAIPTPLRTIRPRSLRQADYVQCLQETTLTLAVGPAGTGKTYLAVAMAVHAFLNRRAARIILTRPAVEAGERLGFLPGDLQAKVDPYLRPLYDALHDMLGVDRVDKMMAQGSLEIAPLAYMRGRTLHEAFIILDEAQNTTPEQMKMFLTRLGEGSQVVAAGDVTQIDLPRGQVSGLVQALSILHDVEGVRVVTFTEADVVRHPLVRRIVLAYQRAEGERRRP
ncbi:MAG: PhoH family protein [Magnetococcales bacterium]|nr:PhoH family protein [Magnetococcales bacterium]